MIDSNQHSEQLKNWQRLSPLSVIFFVGKLVAKILKDALSTLAPLAVIIFNSDDKFWMLVSISTAVVVLVIVGSCLQYWFFKFRRDDNKILVNDGVFKKNHRVIPFDRIQNINILQPLYFKPFDLVIVQIETAGAKGNEADLAGIPSAYAEYLKNKVLLQRANKVSHDNNHKGGSLTASSNQRVIATASLSDLVKYGVSSNGIFWFFVFLAPLIGMADDLLLKIVSKDEFQQFALFFGEGIVGDVLVFIILFLSVLMLMFGFSIVGAIVRYFGYSLTLAKQSDLDDTFMDGTLKRTSGLLTRYEESLKLQKIQTLVCQANLFGRWLKVENLTLGQVSTSQSNTRDKKSLFVIPSSEDRQTKKITSIVFEDSPTEIQTKGIHCQYIGKTIFFKLFLPTAIFCVVIFINTNNYWLFAAPFLLSLAMLPFVVKRWRKYRYGMKSGYGKFERGLFGFRTILFPLYKVQRAEVRQSPFQRRRDLATLKIYLASNMIQMQYIPVENANHWMEVIGKTIKSTKKAWY